jgi:hypothetical protein
MPRRFRPGGHGRSRRSGCCVRRQRPRSFDSWHRTGPCRCLSERQRWTWHRASSAPMLRGSSRRSSATAKGVFAATPRKRSPRRAPRGAAFSRPRRGPALRRTRSWEPPQPVARAMEVRRRIDESPGAVPGGDFHCVLARLTRESRGPARSKVSGTFNRATSTLAEPKPLPADGLGRRDRRCPIEGIEGVWHLRRASSKRPGECPTRPLFATLPAPGAGETGAARCHGPGVAWPVHHGAAR